MHSYLCDVYSNDYEAFINVSAQDNVPAAAARAARALRGWQPIDQLTFSHSQLVAIAI